ncbi:anoctamin-like protein At1g73020 [Hibiscus syriacus]|uniref:anoctamin-like protein At1g73020 n=1 Tax=Hibiscus syriacus TaxID=106335 RepID=UPI0019243A1D|nr:anoctamin-like protein At1g73020 [Hibiscus syriacus]
MNGIEEEDPIVFEIAVVVPRRNLKLENEGYDCVEFLVNEFRNVCFFVDRVLGLHDEFIKLAAPLETLGIVAARLHMTKTTPIGNNSLA